MQFSHKGLHVGPAPKVLRVSVAPLPPSFTSTRALVSTIEVSPAALVLESWTNGSFLQTASSSKSEEAVRGLGGGRMLGSTGLQRLGVIVMEQDRLKAQFVREVNAAVKPLLTKPAGTFNDVSSREAVRSVVSQYRRTAEDLVLRQQLELQGACAIDSICNSAGTSGKNGLWGDDLKVAFRHEDVFEHAVALYDAVLSATTHR